MIRLETETGWWLITHPNHARLAGNIATHWGNVLFAPPEPRASVLHAIHVHDDGWATRDAHPQITREGKPAAFSIELVGKYSAFEEIDLADYLAVRERAVEQVERTTVPGVDPTYAALLVSMHTVNLLTARATIAPRDLQLLDAFLDRQQTRQNRLRAATRANGLHAPDHTTDEAFERNFRLLQACDNLSLLACVAYTAPATLLHPLATRTGPPQTVAVASTTARNFQLTPYPLNTPNLTVQLPARHLDGRTFSTPAELQQRYQAAQLQHLTVTLRT